MPATKQPIRLRSRCPDSARPMLLSVSRCMFARTMDPPNGPYFFLSFTVYRRKSKWLRYAKKGKWTIHTYNRCSRNYLQVRCRQLLLLWFVSGYPPIFDQSEFITTTRHLWSKWISKRNYTILKSICLNLSIIP